MSRFRTMAHSLLRRTYQRLSRSLLFISSSEELPPLDLSQLRDDATDRTPLWNFLQHPHNTQLSTYPTWLFSRLISSISDFNTWFTPRAHQELGSSIPKYSHKAQSFFTELVAFRTDLILLCHILGGQPARGTELLTVRHRNTANGGLRNIFIESGMICIVTTWYKSQNISRQSPIIYRYLPYELGQLLVYYLWLVLPFAEQLQVYYSNAFQIPSHLWCQDPSGRVWHSDRIRRALEDLTLHWLGHMVNLQTYRHLVIGISRRYLSSNIQSFYDKKSLDRAVFADEDIIDQQAAHSSRIAASIYARGLQEQSQITHQHRQYFRSTSIAWHKFLGFTLPHNSQTSFSLGHKRPASESFFTLQERHPRLVVYTEWVRRYQTAFTEIFGRHAQFRPGQSEALQLILQGRSPVCVVLPTGGGKSLLFILPASLPLSRITIVIVPLLSLRQSLIEECIKLRIRACAWDPLSPITDTDLILLTPEAFLLPPFQEFLNSLRTQERIDRIVYDECHTPLHATSSFRSQLFNIWRIGQASIQLVLLTATFPPSRADDLWQRLQINPSTVYTIRVPTTRPNLRYSVISAGVDDVEARIVYAVENSPDGGAIIYTREVRTAHQLAEKLGTRAYYRDAEDKDILLANFLTRRSHILVGTSAISLGINRTDVRLVIHSDLPWTLLEYAQETGRAGRDGQPASCFLFHHGSSMKIESLRDEPLRTFITGRYGRLECRRKLLDLYLDGDDQRVSCDRATEQLCDVCQSLAVSTNLQTKAQQSSP